MKVKTKELLVILDKLKPGLLSKEMVEQATHFTFEGDYVRTYNDNILIAHSYATDFRAAVKAAEFSALLKKIQDAEFEIILGDGKLVMTGGKWEGEIAVEVQLKENQILGSVGQDGWKDLPPDFTEAIKTCEFSVSRNMIRPVLVCIYFSGEYAYSSDGLRATRYRMKSVIPDKLLIHGPAASDLAKHKPEQYALTSDWILFAGEEDLIFGVRVLANADEFPEQVLNIYNMEGTKVNLPDDLDKIVDRCQSLLGSDFGGDRQVSVSVIDGELVCKGTGALGWFEERAQVKDKSGEIPEFLVHPGFLCQIFSRIKSAVVGDHLLFKGDNFDHAISIKVK
uniref:DNA polymerase n=1 Tax=viral metagenome TaxID=1070528 RepID=A0A6M3IM10_9ZZZZ